MDTLKSDKELESLFLLRTISSMFSKQVIKVRIVLRSKLDLTEQSICDRVSNCIAKDMEDGGLAVIPDR
jgi:hypothetical protein